jgi:formylglycine-generating enzyme required for sulfatase activity
MKFPIAGVNVPEIEQFLNWLVKSRKLPGARFCSEVEWERAARGADDRDFPNGYRLDASEANFDETYGQNSNTAGPDTVGTYQSSATHSGLLDMSGNVFEWVSSGLSNKAFLTRSGGFWNPKFASNITNRYMIEPNYRDVQVGIRICGTFSLD